MNDFVAHAEFGIYQIQFNVMRTKARVNGRNPKWQKIKVDRYGEKYVSFYGIRMYLRDCDIKADRVKL